MQQLNAESIKGALKQAKQGSSRQLAVQVPDSNRMYNDMFLYLLITTPTMKSIF